MKRTSIVLQRDVYDALEMAAMVSGGIGWGFTKKWSFDDSPECAVCLWGHAEVAGIVEDASPYAFMNHVYTDAPIPIGGLASDNAVIRVLRHEEKGGRRISFKRWCKALGVVRGNR